MAAQSGTGYMVRTAANTYAHRTFAVTASSAFQGAPFNGLDGALVYYRSQDEGVTWDKMDVQLPSLDTSNFIGMSGDVYAIDARGETVVIAYFDDWGDSFILKSITPSFIS